MDKKLYIPALDIECTYSVQGEGPKVILLHGLCESHAVWKKQTDVLSAKYHVLCPDLPGYGDSQPFPDGNFALEKMQEAVFAIADGEGFKRFAVVGHSMGGYTAAAMLEAQPTRLLGLSLFHSTSHGDSEEKKKGRDKSIKVLRQNRDLFFREVFKNLFNSEHLSQYMPIVQNMYKESHRIDTETVIQTLLALRDRKDRYAVLRNTSVPLSYFIGRHDNVLAADSLIQEAESLTAPYYVSEISGHMAFHESPTEVEKYLLHFLESTVR